MVLQSQLLRGSGTTPKRTHNYFLMVFSCVVLGTRLEASISSSNATRDSCKRTPDISGRQCRFALSSFGLFGLHASHDPAFAVGAIGGLPMENFDMLIPAAVQHLKKEKAKRKEITEKLVKDLHEHSVAEVERVKSSKQLLKSLTQDGKMCTWVLSPHGERTLGIAALVTAQQAVEGVRACACHRSSPPIRAPVHWSIGSSLHSNGLCVQHAGEAVPHSHQSL
eukprot:4307571-Amphidinium_carterae.2